jgi:hypothetical protein
MKRPGFFRKRTWTADHFTLHTWFSNSGRQLAIGKNGALFWQFMVSGHAELECIINQ